MGANLTKEDFGMEIFKVMHPHADWAHEETAISDVAEMMMRADIGAVPVGRDEKLIGMITDRDIAIRVVAKGLDPKKTTARDVMTAGIVYCHTHETVEDAIHLMEQRKVRRLPVIDNKKQLVGMLSLGDIAQSASHDLSGKLLHAVSDHHP